MSHLVTSHITSTRADRVLRNPFLLKCILSNAPIPTLGRCLRVSNDFFVAAGALLYRELEISADVLVGPMCEGLDVESQSGYRHIRPRQRNTIRPLLEQVRRLTLVFINPVRFEYIVQTFLARALTRVDDLVLYFGCVGPRILTFEAPYSDQSLLQILSCTPTARSVTCCFHTRALGDFGGAQIGDLPSFNDPLLREIPLTLVIGARPQVISPTLPTVFTEFQRLRIIYAQKSVEGDINRGRPLNNLRPEGVFSREIDGGFFNSQYTLQSWIQDLAGIACDRDGKSTEVYLLDDLGCLAGIPTGVEPGDIGLFIRQEAEELEGLPLTDDRLSQFTLKSRRAFLEEVQGVLEPDVLALYQRMEDTPREVKMARENDESERFTAYLFGEWTIVSA